MEIVTNDLILRSQFKDKYTAIQEIKKSIQILGAYLPKEIFFGSGRLRPAILLNSYLMKVMNY